MDQHFDAERLAAFADGSLSPTERAAAEAHAADCPRCLQMLAAMARTEPPAIRTGWRLPVIVRWAGPVAAAATVVAIWVNVARDRRPDPVPPAPSTVTTAPAPAPVPSVPPPAPESVGGIAGSAAPQRQAPSGGRLLKEPAPTAKPRDDAADVDRKRFEARDARETRTRDAVQPKAEEKVTAPPSVAAGPPATVDTLRSRAAGNAGALSHAAGQVAVVDVISPDPSVRWRARGNRLERSTDGGQTWTATSVFLQHPAVAGASPARNVAWLAGGSGSVWRTIDGDTWQRLEFPEAVQLIAIRAVSDREADVTAVDGRVFRTTDGGRTWSLQETARSPF